MCRFGDAKACLLLPAGSKPTAGTFDWLETAIYQGQSSDLTGTPLDIWASSTEVSNVLYFYYASRYMTVKNCFAGKSWRISSRSVTQK